MNHADKAAPGSYRLIRSDRKTLAISLDGEGRLIARAPLSMPVWQIERFIQQKASWIEKKRGEMNAKNARSSRYSLAEGGRLPWMGGEISVQRHAGKKAAFQNGTLYLPNSADPSKAALQWFRAAAEKILPRYVEKWAAITGIRPEKTGYGYAKSRWGSMSSDGTLRLNIALLHCPPWYIDYVVLHELVHRRHMNHSPAFHAMVESYYPGAGRIRKEGKKLCGSYIGLLHQPNGSNKA